MDRDQSQDPTMRDNSRMQDDMNTPTYNDTTTTPATTEMAGTAAPYGTSGMTGTTTSSTTSTSSTASTGATSGTVVGVFADGASAERAVQQLKDAGFTEEEIGYASRHPGDSATAMNSDAGTAMNAEPAGDTLGAHLAGEHHGGTREGLVMGGVTGLAFGSIVGAAAALLLPGIGPVVAGGILGAALIGGAAGTVTGGVAGALRDWGFSHEDVEYYHSEFEAGRTIVSVHAGARAQEATGILRQNGAQRVSSAGGNAMSSASDTMGTA